MTLDAARDLILHGIPYADVWGRLDADDKVALKAWYLATPGVPLRTRPVQPSANGVHQSEPEPCSTCGGLRMVRSGSCSTCLDCGSTSGCS